MTAISGFRKCRIFPLHPNVFNDEDYAAAEMTGIHLDLEKNAVPSSSGGSSQHPTDESSSSSPQCPTTEESPSQHPTGRFHVSPKDINPLPKAKNLKQRQTNRKKGKTAIITSSPCKDELTEERRKKRIALNENKRKLEEK
ncbi:hypothetical protein PR048_020895 [Dryococelus australis]|uniref:BZIP domain-containing protein n=1 Tax=Dryococelus australis TaxID=614101 RepID=A0ABQ9GWN8_9NEOP|nr:hypothetical protein PR048_020895 [Dryococelus australis]